MGEGRQDGSRLQFDARVRLQFNGSQLTSDAGLLACRELDEALDLNQSAADLLAEPRTGGTFSMTWSRCSGKRSLAALQAMRTSTMPTAWRTTLPCASSWDGAVGRDQQRAPTR